MHFATNNLRCTTSSPLNSIHTFPVQFHYYCIWITVLKIQKSGRIILLSQLRIRILAKQTVKNILKYFNKNRNKGGWQHYKLQVWTNNYRKRKHAGSTATVTGLYSMHVKCAEKVLSHHKGLLKQNPIILSILGQHLTQKTSNNLLFDH